MNNYKAKTVKMQGFSGREEEVVPARERLLELKSSGTPYTISTEPQEFMGKGFFKCLLTILLNPVQYFTGSSEIKNEVGGFESAETRSIGRALAAYGIAIESNYAGAEEFDKVQTQDPGATNSVRETLDKLAIIKERQSETPVSESESLPEKEVLQPSAKRTRNTGKTVVENKPEIQEAPKEAQNQPELPINKEEIVAEVPENPIIEADKPVVRAEAVDEEPNWFHRKPDTQGGPIVLEAKEVVEAKPEPPVENKAGDQGNQFGIDIPELVDGARGFNIYIPVIMALEAKKDDMMADVSQAIVKLGLKDFISADKNTEHWELLLRTGSKAVVNSVLNTLGK